MIPKSLILLIHEAASIQRWNDHIRPWTGFTELDKQAHKMFYAYVLGRCEGEDRYDRLKLVEGGIYEFFHRIIMTDIKPPIYHKLVKEKGTQIDQWVLNELKSQIEPISHGSMFENMERYFLDKDYAVKEKKILKAAHYHASNWEFNVIYPMNSTTFGIEQVKREMIQGLAACDTFMGFRYFAGSPYLQDFLSLIGKLRYQQRWSKAARIPQTFVMGHMLVVAILSFLCVKDIGGCEQRLINTFFGGLFHDLPEVLTRDIVSPVKSSVKGLDSIIHEIEDEQMKDVIYPLMPEEWIPEVEYFTKDEFSSKIKVGNWIKCVDSDEINEGFNENKYNPIDGQIIRGCDHLSAYVEAYLSLNYGVRSEQMQSGYDHLKDRYKNKIIGGVGFGELFEYFEL